MGNNFTLTSLAILFLVVLAPTPAWAPTCYAKVGAACVKKSYGNLDSSCTNACAVGIYLYKDTAGNQKIAGDGIEGTEMVITGTGGARPADCPVGSFYEGADGQIKACEDDVAFTLEAPKNVTLSDGKPLPQGAMMLKMSPEK